LAGPVIAFPAWSFSMGKKDPRVDAYIAQAADFARPILKHLRAVVHKNCPDVEETLKWSVPAFMHHGILCNMAAFKAHCTFGFWKHDLIVKDDGTADTAMGSFGRLTSVDQLPSDKVLAGYLKKAMAFNEAGIKITKPKSKAKKELVIPDYFMAAVKQNKKALAAFEAFSYSHKKEYVEWVTEAKGEDTRRRRLDTAVQWLAEGKSRNWKYEKC
jgi:uncharacterized protein YdeI (YjbR/CyaY-like superfamily)